MSDRRVSIGGSSPRDSVQRGGDAVSASLRQVIEGADAAIAEYKRLDDEHMAWIRSTPEAWRMSPAGKAKAAAMSWAVDRAGDRIREAEIEVMVAPARSIADVIAKVEWLWSGEIEDHDSANFDGRAFRALLADLRRVVPK